MTHYDGFDALIRESSHLYMTFFRVRDGQHTISFTVESAESVWIVACVQAIDQGEVSKVVNIGFDCENDNHSTYK